jgi:acyl-CoA thioesterase
MERDALAQACGEAMWRGDRTAQWFGMTLEEVRAGYARMSMTVTAAMVNAHNTCHGGAIFTLADATFGYACNSHNQNALAASGAIEYLAPAYLDDRLTAVGVEQLRAGRQGIYDARVTNQRGELIALFRGKSVTVKGHLVEVR